MDENINKRTWYVFKSSGNIGAYLLYRAISKDEEET